MGNRAVITTDRDSLDVAKSNEIGVYLHWNGGRDSVEAFLAYCKLKNYRKPGSERIGMEAIKNFVEKRESLSNQHQE